MKHTAKQATDPATISPVPRLADDLEAVLLAAGVDVLALARPLLDDPVSPYTEVRYAGLRLAECLADALRVSESRGMRLLATDAEDGGQATQEAGSGPWS